VSAPPSTAVRWRPSPLILKAAVSAPANPPARNLYDRIHTRFAAIGGAELEIPHAIRRGNRPVSTDVPPLYQHPLGDDARANPAPEIAAWGIRPAAGTALHRRVCQAEILSGLAIMPKAAAARSWKPPHMHVRGGFRGQGPPFDMQPQSPYA